MHSHSPDDLHAEPTQIYDGVGKTYSHFFEAPPAQVGAGAVQVEHTPSTASFKVLAETPLQGRCF